ncbi:probable glycosyl hydrolase [Hahella chejuensis KCTC 2396]|uniref:Probable glycosyl hydrolase n=1 Tax=Hahella chejuensis (strain KCTC 2396) TaxID=349521 RepID=Q2SKN4_HAHCH|nr:hypothetical protein [Hahella chejuensis]ABC28790.1 probable glycosyl hydrolase [Hahella chejuensis KCTC 2396]
MKTVLTIRSVAMALALITTLAAAEDDLASCDSDVIKWFSSKNYEAGDLTFYDGVWYRSRMRHSGMQPGIGFTWEKLDLPPCESILKAAGDESTTEQDQSHSAMGTENRLPVDAQTVEDVPARAETDGASTLTPEPAVDHSVEVQVEDVGSDDWREKESLISQIKNLLSPEPESNGLKCADIKPWSFAQSYYVSDLVSYKGHYYSAIRNSNGGYPDSMQTPPSWKPIELDCGD